MSSPGTALFPDYTSVEIVSLDELCDPALQRARDYWRMLRGTRHHPARADVNARDIAFAMKHMVLAKVVDGGADLLLSIVGDEVCRAYSTPMNGRRISEIAGQMPKVAEKWRFIHRMVAASREPVAVNVNVGLDQPEVNYTHLEVVCFPLGPDDNTIDHLLVFGKHMLRTA